MCGIFGIVSERCEATRIVDGLRCLEYRGYDSAGIAVVNSDGAISCIKTKGKLFELENKLKATSIVGSAGIGHTRWATHGSPTEKNAHPHVKDKVAVVHNGIIENYQEIRDELMKQGRVFITDTDTEVLAHLVNDELSAGKAPLLAVSNSLDLCIGSFAASFVFASYSDLIIASKRGAPLVVGYGASEMFIGSDVLALSSCAKKVSYMEDGDIVELTHDGATFHDQYGCIVFRHVANNEVSTAAVDRGKYRHFMAKEINEQPDVIKATLEHYIDFSTSSLLPMKELCWDRMSWIDSAACGTAYYAGLVGKYWFESFADIRVNVDVSSEFRYRSSPLDTSNFVLLISQSGETADTLAVLKYCRSKGIFVASIANVLVSTIARESDVVFPTFAGIERSVASTKAFTCQLAVLAVLAIAAGRARGVLSESQEHELVDALIQLPKLVSNVLGLQPQIEVLSKKIAASRSVFYLGRGTSFPVALEGALKLKEIAYLHAEGHPAGEMKHGPIAFVDEQVPVIIVAPTDHVFKKTISNAQEITARGGLVTIITDKHGVHSAKCANVSDILVLPEMHNICVPIVYSIPLQLLSYNAALVLGTEVDQPRNLAKSVTVE